MQNYQVIIHHGDDRQKGARRQEKTSHLNIFGALLTRYRFS